MAAPIIYREPIEFAQGDTLSFTRILPDYPASQSWSIQYFLTGGPQPIQFNSTASGDSHVILVLPAVTANWLPGSYILAGYVINSGSGERHQIYYGSLPIYEDWSKAPGGSPVQTFAQQMIAQLETVMLAKASGDLAESSIENSRFRYLSPEELRKEHGYWSQVRRQEIAKERSKAGLPTGNKIRARVNVMGTGPIIGQGTPFSGYGGW